MKTNMKRILNTLTAFTLALLLTSPVLALDLDSAKSQGLVGEKIDGYLGVVKPSSEVNALVSSINAKRKSRYQRMSKETGTPQNQVERLGGEKFISLTPRGQYINRGSGWVKK